MSRTGSTYSAPRVSARVAAMFFAAMAAPAISDEVTIDFDRLLTELPSSLPNPYLEDGFVIELSPPDGCVTPNLNYGFRLRNAGNVAVMPPVMIESYCNGLDELTGAPIGPPEYRSTNARLRRVDNQPFDMLSLLLFNETGGSDEGIVFTATTTDGRTVVSGCSGQPLWENSKCEFDERFRGLVSVSWTDGNKAETLIMDDIVLTSSTVYPTPWIEVTPQRADFGPVVVYGSATLRVNVRNKGTAPLSISAIAQADPLAPPFSVTQNACSGRSLPPDQECFFSVAFNPQGPGEYSDTLKIESDDPYAPGLTVEVLGVAVTVGGETIGLDRLTVTCENQTQKSKVTFPVTSEERGYWDCQTAGLPVRSGDQILIKVKGVAQ